MIKIDADELMEEFRAVIRNTYDTTLEQAKRDSGVLRSYISIVEGATYVGCSKNFFRDNFMDKGLPAYRIEGTSKIWVKREEIDTFLSKYQIN